MFVFARLQAMIQLTSDPFGTSPLLLLQAEPPEKRLRLAGRTSIPVIASEVNKTSLAVVAGDDSELHPER